MCSKFFLVLYNMDKLLIIFLFFLILYYSNKVYRKKYGNITNELFSNNHISKKVQPYVIDFFNIVNNPIDYTNYKTLSLYKESKKKNLLDIVFDKIKKNAVFVSLNKSNKKPIIGIFLASTQILSHVLDQMNITEQDFLNQGTFTNNGLVMFYLMTNQKYLKNKKVFEKLFDKLIQKVIEKSNKEKYDYFIYPMIAPKSYYMDERTKVLKEKGFAPIFSYTLNGHYYRKYIPKNIFNK